MTNKLRTWCEISLDAIEHNIKELKKTVEKGTKLVGVVNNSKIKRTILSFSAESMKELCDDDILYEGGYINDYSCLFDWQGHGTIKRRKNQGHVEEIKGVWDKDKLTGGTAYDQDGHEYHVIYFSNGTTISEVKPDDKDKSSIAFWGSFSESYLNNSLLNKELIHHCKNLSLTIQRYTGVFRLDSTKNLEFLNIGFYSFSNCTEFILQGLNKLESIHFCDYSLRDINCLILSSIRFQSLHPSMKAVL